MKFPTIILVMAAMVAGQQPTSIPADVMSAIQSVVHNGGASTADINALISQASSVFGTNFASVTSQFSSEIASASSVMIAPTGGVPMSQSNKGVIGSNPSKMNSGAATATSAPSSNSNANSISVPGLSLAIALAYGLWY